MKREGLNSSETAVPNCWTSRCHNWGNRNANCS